MNWLRLWHEMPTDPKWRTIARRSGQSISTVIAVYNFLLVNASANSDERGTLKNWTNEDVASCLDISEEDVAAVCREMQGRVLDGDKLAGWDNRQPKREDDSSERVKKHRQQKPNPGNDPKRNVTQSNAQETDRNAPEEIQSREDKKTTPTEGGGVVAVLPKRPPSSVKVLPITLGVGAEERLADWSKPDASELAKQVIPKVQPNHPIACYGPLAEKAVRDVFLQSENPEETAQLIIETHASHCRIWRAERAENPNSYIPPLHTWIESGAYLQRSVLPTSARKSEESRTQQPVVTYPKTKPTAEQLRRMQEAS